MCSVAELGAVTVDPSLAEPALSERTGSLGMTMGSLRIRSPKSALGDPVPSQRPLWQCPKCGRQFANRNQSHACARYDLERHFNGKPPQIRALFEHVRAAIEAIGPVILLPEKTRIAFQVRMSFAQVTPRRRWLDGHVVLARRVEHPAVRKGESISPGNHVHHFRVTRPEDVTPALIALFREAYAVGEQRHLERHSSH